LAPAPSDAHEEHHADIDALLNSLPADDALNLPELPADLPADRGSASDMDNDMLEHFLGALADEPVRPEGATDDIATAEPGAEELDQLLEDHGLFSFEDGGLSIADLLEFEEGVGAEPGSAGPTTAAASGSSAARDAVRNGIAESSAIQAAKLSGAKKRAGVARRAAPEALVRMLKARGTSAAQVRAALARAPQRRKLLAVRSQRVRDSFLSGAEAAMNDRRSRQGSGDGEVAAVQLAPRPEVVRRAPQTPEERLASLYQALVEARKAWEENTALLRMMLGARVRNRSGQDARIAQLRAQVAEEASSILEASGALLLARVQLGVGKLPEQQVYHCTVDGTKQVRAHIHFMLLTYLMAEQICEVHVLCCCSHCRNSEQHSNIVMCLLLRRGRSLLRSCTSC
jgi:hypothetical protein